MKLALFDLDNTLINGDSDVLWAHYLIDRGVLDAATHQAQSDAFYQNYLDGQLDIKAWMRFQLEPLTRYPLATLHEWRQEFLETQIKPIVLKKGLEVIQHHRNQGAEIVIITATNDFVTTPIAELLGISNLIASMGEKNSEGRYTGQPTGIPSYRDGKITRLLEWLAKQGRTLSNYNDTWFYSDSHNDIPLLSMVKHPVAVNPDVTLLKHAQKSGWTIADFRQENASGMQPL